LLTLKRNDVLGLDIGSSSVKIVQLGRNGSGYFVKAAGICEIQDNAPDDSGRRDLSVVQAIQNCFSLVGVRTRMVVTSVCGPEVAVRNFTFPKLPKDELEGAVRLEASQVCPFSVEDGVVDYQIVPNGDERVRGIFVAATNKAIRQKERFVKSASLRNVLMDVDGLALLNCFNQCAKPDGDGTIAIVNVGDAYTTVVVSGLGGLPFIRDMTCAGAEIVEQIAQERDMPAAQVRRILTCEVDDESIDFSDSLHRACGCLVGDVMKTLRYYSTQEKSASVEKVYVCGEFALVNGLVEALNNQLAAEAVLWNPFEQMDCSRNEHCKQLVQEKGPAMAVAAGLAMRSI